MPTGAEYQARISTYKWDDLINLWSEIELGNTKTVGWDKGKALEYLVLRAFQLDGADVTWPYSVYRDRKELEQIDGVVYADGLACLIECKDTSEAIKFEPIAKLKSQLLRRPTSTVASVFSRNGFTESAETLTISIAPHNVFLWTGSEIYYCLQNKCICRGLIKKYRFCVEQGLPNYNITIEAIP
ncbi:MAG: restriction endonuclease [Nostocales cyanobacterium ELA583]|jgi:hypothetical protein